MKGKINLTVGGTSVSFWPNRIISTIIQFMIIHLHQLNTNKYFSELVFVQQVSNTFLQHEIVAHHVADSVCAPTLSSTLMITLSAALRTTTI